MSDFKLFEPAKVRAMIAGGELTIPTAGVCPGYIQANLAILKKEYAEDLKEFARKNPKPCPILEIIEDGTPISKIVAPGSNVTTDIPKYMVYRNGVLVDEPTDVSDLWTDDMVVFLIGCSLTFEAALVRAGIRLKHYEQNKRVPMYDSNIACDGVGKFQGNYVVSMRPVKRNLVDKAVEITGKMDYAHGAPVHIGDPLAIGIKNVFQPDYGDPLDIAEDEIPVFWACGVTPQAVARNAKPDLLIAHSPGYMLITDQKCGAE